MKRIFITGAAGFIGSHLMRALATETVLGYDNFNSYTPVQLKRDRSTGLEIIEGNICNQSQLRETVENFAPTHILHLAAQAGVRYSLEQPQAYVDANITGFLNILELCRDLSLPLVYASSSSAAESVSLYGATKSAGEQMAHAYHSCFGIPTTGLRYHTVYGPWGRPDMAYYSFTEAMLASQPIRLFNRGEMARDFTYIDDIVAGTVAALEINSGCQVFDLGSDSPQPLMRLVELLETGLAVQAKKEWLPMQTGDVRRTHADIGPAREQLGYSPMTSLEEGVAKFLAWHMGYTAQETGVGHR